MNAASCKALHTQSWKELYQAAKRESDMNQPPERIADAEASVVMRTFGGNLFFVNFHSITFDLLLTIQVLCKASQKHATVSVSKRRSANAESVNAGQSMQINHS